MVKMENKIYLIQMLIDVDNTSNYSIKPTFFDIKNIPRLDIKETKDNIKGIISEVDYCLDGDENKIVLKEIFEDIIDDKGNLTGVVVDKKIGVWDIYTDEYYLEEYTKVNLQYVKIDSKGDSDWSKSITELTKRRKNIKGYIESEASKMKLENGVQIGTIMMNDIFSYYANNIQIWIENGYINAFYEKMDDAEKDFLDSGLDRDTLISQRIVNYMNGINQDPTSELIGAFLSSDSLSPNTTIKEWLKRYIYEYQIKL